MPLHTIRADIDYGFAEAKTTYGRSASGLGQQGRDHARGLRGHVDRGRRASGPGSGPPQARARRGSRRVAREGAAQPGSRRSRPRQKGRRVRWRGSRRWRRSRVGGGRGRPPAPGGVASGGRPASRGAASLREAEPKARSRPIADARRAPEVTERTPKGLRLMLLPAGPSTQAHRGRRRASRRASRPCSSAITGSRRSRTAGSPTVRSRPPDRDDAQDPPRRQGLDQPVPGQAVHEEARRDAMGRQGLARGWVAVVKPGRVLSSSRRRRGTRREALRSPAKASIKVKFVRREADLFES